MLSGQSEAVCQGSLICRVTLLWNVGAWSEDRCKSWNVWRCGLFGDFISLSKVFNLALCYLALQSLHDQVHVSGLRSFPDIAFGDSFLQGVDVAPWVLRVSRESLLIRPRTSQLLCVTGLVDPSSSIPLSRLSGPCFHRRIRTPLNLLQNLLLAALKVQEKVVASRCVILSGTIVQVERSLIVVRRVRIDAFLNLVIPLVCLNIQVAVVDCLRKLCFFPFWFLSISHLLNNLELFSAQVFSDISVFDLCYHCVCSALSLVYCDWYLRRVSHDCRTRGIASSFNRVFVWFISLCHLFNLN